MKAHVLTVFAMFATFSVSAHHGVAALYELDQELVVEGVVAEFRFVNPHARIYLDVTDADGVTEQWLVEGGTPVVLLRLGWTGEEVSAGDRVRIRGNPGRDGAKLAKLIRWLGLTLEDGTELFAEDVNFDAVDRRRRRQ